MSNLPTIENVRARRAAIASEREALLVKNRALSAEDQELEVAERALLRLAATSTPQAQLTPAVQTTINLLLQGGDLLGDWISPDGWQRPDKPLPPNPTVEEGIAWVLEGAKNPWATANQIQLALSNTLGRPVPMSSISPTLTIMKNKGTIVRNNLLVALASKVQTEKAASD